MGVLCILCVYMRVVCLLSKYWVCMVAAYTGYSGLAYICAHRNVYRSSVAVLGLQYRSSIRDEGGGSMHICVYMRVVCLSSQYWVCMVLVYTECWGLAYIYMCTHRYVQVFSSSPGSVS